MTDKRRFFCIYPSTLIVLGFTLGTVIILNIFFQELNYGPTVPIPGGSSGSVLYYFGWPWYYEREFRSQPYLPYSTQWYPDGLRNNIIFTIVILSTIGVVFESVRRRFSTFIDCKPRMFVSVIGILLSATTVLGLNLVEGYYGDILYGWPIPHLYIDDHGFGEAWNLRHLSWNVFVAAGCIVISAYLFNRLTRARSPRRFQVHLSTFLAVAIATAIYLFLNIAIRDGSIQIGWPFFVYGNQRIYELHGDFEDYWLPRLGLLENILIYLSGAITIALMSEHFIRRRKAREQTPIISTLG